MISGDAHPELQVGFKSQYLPEYFAHSTNLNSIFSSLLLMVDVNHQLALFIRNSGHMFLFMNYFCGSKCINLNQNILNDNNFSN